MKHISILFLLFGLTILSSSAQTSSKDTAWIHTIDESEIILKVKVLDRSAMTEIYIYNCEILEVLKGEFKEKILAFDVEWYATSRDMFNKQFNAIQTKEIVLIGFRKTIYSTDFEVNGVQYEFFMSQ